MQIICTSERVPNTLEVFRVMSCTDNQLHHRITEPTPVSSLVTMQTAFNWLASPEKQTSIRSSITQQVLEDKHFSTPHGIRIYALKKHRQVSRSYGGNFVYYSYFGNNHPNKFRLIHCWTVCKTLSLNVLAPPNVSESFLYTRQPRELDRYVIPRKYDARQRKSTKINYILTTDCNVKDQFAPRKYGFDRCHVENNCDTINASRFSLDSDHGF